ncbi:unnamed protein product [Rotaria socialis]|uniref:MULE transposase domain-containing protein n=1 Tax=Rotaria socialis TaxID=392032 RepID=A0A817U5P6_9BILA|nr:unnamed protein product [Rotaria socialis]CAF4855129.1 unnamed protein product [Rotaria socialis]
MPVITRAAALRSKIIGVSDASLDEATLPATSVTKSTAKTTRTCGLKQKQKERAADSTINCSKPETGFESQQQSSISKTESVLQANVNSDDEETAVLLPSPDQTAATFVTKSSTENSDHSIVSLDSSNNNDIVESEGDADVFLNVPVVKGEIISGTSIRKGKMIFMNGFSYLYMSTAKETIGWRCARRNVNCKAVIHTLKTTGEFSRWNGVFHYHTVDPNEARKREILGTIKKRVLDEHIPVKIIVEQEYRKANLSTEEKRIIPLPSKIESGLHKTRRRALPPVPRDQKFVVPPVYLETYSKEPFLIYDKRKSQYGGRLMMFASPEQLDVLFHSDILFADGTFRVSPILFEQLYVLLGMQHGEAVPVCFILTSNRRHETYEAILRCLRRIGSKKGIDLKPRSIICDFERAFMKAVVKQLPETLVTGCWFHFCQSCYRNIQKLGLMKVYDTDAEARHLLRAFMGLALLPMNLIHDGFIMLKKKVKTSCYRNQLEVFVSYFKSEWIDHFKPSMWCVSNSRWRTNNFAEAQNRRFFSRVVQPHPNLWRFIQCLKEEESVVSHRMVQTGLGFSSTRPSKSTRAAARKTKQVEKLLNLLQSNKRSLIDTIMSFAYLVGEPVGRGKKEKKNKNNISKSDSSSPSSSIIDSD